MPSLAAFCSRQPNQHAAPSHLARASHSWSLPSTRARCHPKISNAAVDADWILGGVSASGTASPSRRLRGHRQNCHHLRPIWTKHPIQYLHREPLAGALTARHCCSVLSSVRWPPSSCPMDAQGTATSVCLTHLVAAHPVGQSRPLLRLYHSPRPTWPVSSPPHSLHLFARFLSSSPLSIFNRSFVDRSSLSLYLSF